MLNEQMAEVAAFFSGKFRSDRDVILAEHLNRSKLNLSTDSLHAVDDWLLCLRNDGLDPGSREAAETIIWSGAYVGEVIRACATKRVYSWKHYKEHMQGQPESIRNIFPYSFGTQFILISQPDRMTLPINKVIRFLAEGPENNLHFYASAECSR